MICSNDFCSNKFASGLLLHQCNGSQFIHYFQWMQLLYLFVDLSVLYSLSFHVVRNMIAFFLICVLFLSSSLSPCWVCHLVDRLSCVHSVNKLLLSFLLLSLFHVYFFLASFLSLILTSIVLLLSSAGYYSHTRPKT